MNVPLPDLENFTSPEMVPEKLRASVVIIRWPVPPVLVMLEPLPGTVESLKKP